MRLDNKVAIVTGGSSGIGKETVFKFLSEGASVVAADINTETLDQLDSEIAEKFSNKKFTSFKCDVCLLYTSPSPRDGQISRMPSSA